MDPSIVIRLIILVVLLACSAFFSSAETALTTVNHISMLSMADEGNKKAKMVLKVTDNSAKMLSAILIGNNVVNLSASSLATTLAVDVFGSKGAGIATGILTFLVLIFGEIAPKTMATLRAEKFSLAMAGIIWSLMVVLTPVIIVINKLAAVVLRILGVKEQHRNITVTENEIRTIVEVGNETGVIEDEEKEIINNLLDFGETEAKDVMIPRVDMTFVHVDCTYSELLRIYRQDHYTRYPVYSDSTDDVVGVINMKDMILVAEENFSVRRIMREPYFTHEHKNTSELMMEMRSSLINFAIVIDEYGATAGLITLEDLIEEIVGEIRDEYDYEEEDVIQKIKDNEYLVEASVNLEHFAEELNLKIDTEDYDTLGGYMIGLLDHLPKVRESVVAPDGMYMQVRTKTRNRINKIYVKLPEEETIDK